MWKEVYTATWLPLTLSQGFSAESGWWGEWSEWTPCTRTCGAGVSYQNRTCKCVDWGEYNLMQLCFIILFVCCCSNGTCSGADKQYRSCCVQVGSCMCWNVSPIKWESLMCPNVHIRDCCATIQVCWLHVIFPSCPSCVLLTRLTSVLSSVQDSIISP